MFEGEESELDLFPMCGRPMRASDQGHSSASRLHADRAWRVEHRTVVLAGPRRGRPNPQRINFVWDEEAWNFFVLGEGAQGSCSKGISCSKGMNPGWMSAPSAGGPAAFMKDLVED